MEDRRFIEETFPIKEVSEESAREKNIRHGHISTTHIWWARRPLASSRATNFAALVRSPSGRNALRKTNEFIIKLSKWDNVSHETILNEARDLILKTTGQVTPKVLDPFAGGGSIPLEALRLGCETYASDYNPVAALVLKCTLEFPSKFAGSNSVKPPSLISVVTGNRLLEDIKKWSNWVLQESYKELSKFYPAQENGSVNLGYFWARDVPCQNPTCNAKIPLIRQFWLAKKPDRLVACFPIVTGKKVTFKLVGTGYGSFPRDFDPGRGTIARAVVTCPICGSRIEAEMTRHLFEQGKSGEEMFAIVSRTRGKLGRTYKIAEETDIKVLREADIYLQKKRKILSEQWGTDPIPDEPLPPVGTLGFRIGRYNMKSWGDLFNPRQKLAILTFTEKVRLAYDAMLQSGYEENYARAIDTYLAFMVSKLCDFNSRLSRWANHMEKSVATFGRQALPMLWDYCEINPFSGSTGSWTVLSKWTIDSIQTCLDLPRPGTVSECSATNLPYMKDYFDAVFTDPPYYDNVPYSHLSDFFYVWLKRSVGNLYPELFSTPLTPKSDEIVAYPEIEGGPAAAKRFFENSLRKSFLEIHRVLKPTGIVIVVYAHKSTEGWESLINSLLDSGLVVTAAWPIHTEKKSRMRGQESAALASSIYVIARKSKRSQTGFYGEVKQELKDSLARKLDLIWQEGISGADFFISAIGSSIEVFGKYQKVIDDGGNQIRADKLLEDVRRIVTDYAVKQVLHNGFASEIKPITRFYVLWRWAYGNSILEYDEARKLGQSVGIDVSQEWNRGFISKRKELIEVLGPEDRELDSLEDSTELINVLHRVLLLWKRGRYAEITKILRETGFGKSDVFYRVAQAVSESLANGVEEKKLLEGFLVGKERIAKEVSKESAQRRLFE